MKKVMMGAAAALLLAAGAASAQDSDELQVLRGDEGLACKAIICLAAVGGAPSECADALRRYFSISASKPSKLKKKRRNFLNLCPDDNPPDLVESLINGRCNANYQDCAPAGSAGGAAGQEANTSAEASSN